MIKVCPEYTAEGRQAPYCVNFKKLSSPWAWALHATPLRGFDQLRRGVGFAMHGHIGEC